jgi:hypothetical protein
MLIHVADMVCETFPDDNGVFNHTEIFRILPAEPEEVTNITINLWTNPNCGRSPYKLVAGDEKNIHKSQFNNET